jgi:hypothetical protein
MIYYEPFFVCETMHRRLFRSRDAMVKVHAFMCQVSAVANVGHGRLLSHVVNIRVFLECA